MKGEDLKKYISWIEERRSFSAIREDLLKQGVPSDSIKGILLAIDDFHSRKKIQKMNNRNGLQWMIAGAILGAMALALFIIGSIPFIIISYSSLVSSRPLKTRMRNKY